MTEVYRDGVWQSVSEKTHPQDIPANRWTPLRWVGSDGKGHRALRVLAEGPQDFDYAIRVRSLRDLFGPQTRITVRIRRYPEEEGDAGTRWQGPWICSTNESALYITGRTMDDKGATVGHGYGVDVKATRAVRVDQYMPKLDPRRT